MTVNVSFETMESRSLMSSTGLSETLKDHLGTLRSSLNLANKDQAKTALANLTAALKTADSPSAKALKKFKADAAAAFSDKKLTKNERATLVADFKAVLTSAGVTNKLSKKTAQDLADTLGAKTATTKAAQGVVTQLGQVLTALK
jgi:hypothetical protein